MFLCTWDRYFLVQLALRCPLNKMNVKTIQ